MQNVFVGTDLKLSINATIQDGIHLSNCEFCIYAYCNNVNRNYEIHKDECSPIYSDDNKEYTDSYVFIIDTNNIGTGNLKLKIVIEVPDTDFSESDGFTRTEVIIYTTDIQIVKAQ